MIDFRVAYRQLTDEEKGRIERIKLAAETLDDAIGDVEGMGRLTALARTHLETAVMFAVKARTA
jgi:hypothetical protein